MQLQQCEQVDAELVRQLGRPRAEQHAVVTREHRHGHALDPADRVGAVLAERELRR